MAPVKSRQIPPAQSTLSVTTRSKSNLTKTTAIYGVKRKNVISPDKMVKRSAFGDLTNAVSKKSEKEPSKTSKLITAKKTNVKPVVKATNAKTETDRQVKSNNEIRNTLQKTGKETVTSKTEKVAENLGTVKPNIKVVVVKPKPLRSEYVKVAAEPRLLKNASQAKCETLGNKKQQNENLKAWARVIKHIPDSKLKSKLKQSDIKDENKENCTKAKVIEGSVKCEDSGAVNRKTCNIKTQASSLKGSSPKKSSETLLPPGIEDFDKKFIKDPFQSSEYAADVFNYMKSREDHYKIKNYMKEQITLRPSMRALVVDWMVEVQQNFQMNHESLYLAVKLLDSYLSKVKVQKNEIQLIAAVALLVACKYDEQTFPYVDDFVYACDGAYTKKQFMQTEIKLVKAVDYNLGFPISYRFLRRYARVGRIDMPSLTLARYILELSLIDYSFVSDSDSKLAAAALLLALKMKSKDWDANLEHFSGYKVVDLKDLVNRLNKMLHSVPANLNETKDKYSAKEFFEVTKVPLLTRLTF